MAPALVNPDEIAIDVQAAETTRKQAAAVISRGSQVELRDDPEARAAFLSTFTAEEEAKIIRKVDLHIVILIGLMSMIKQVDANSASNVKVLQVGEPSNIITELGMTANLYNWVGSIYGIAYIIFEAPSNLLLKRFTPHVWQSRIFFTWGIITGAHAAVQNHHQLFAVRFLLGMFEAGMFPGVMAHLHSWYRTEEMGKPVAWFFGINATSTILGSLLCYGVSYMNGVRGLSAWRWVYIIQGVFTVLFSGVVFFLLPDYPKSPRSRKWLTEREQEFLEARLSENAPLTSDPVFSFKEIKHTLSHWLIWSFLCSQTLVNLGGYALTWYLPTIITNLGFAKLPKNQLLNIPPAAATILGEIFAAWFLYRAFIVRPALIMIIMSGMVVCFVLFFTLENRVGLYIACILGSVFYSTYFIPFWAWRSATLVGTTGTALTYGLQSGIAQLGGVVGPQLFQSKWAHNRYKNSFAIAASFIIAGWVSNVWTWYLTRNTEYDVLRVQRLQLKARKEGRTLVADDIKIFEERQFYDGVKLKKAEESDSDRSRAA